MIEGTWEELTCWACTRIHSEEYMPQRCHVSPYSETDSVDPREYVLLCEWCHREQPDEVSLEVLFEWMLCHESHDQRVTRLVMQRHRALERIARKRGAQDKLEEWCELLMQDVSANPDDYKNSKFYTLNFEYTRFPTRFGSRFGSAYANVMWAGVQAFVDWLDGKFVIEQWDGKLVVIEQPKGREGSVNPEETQDQEFIQLFMPWLSIGQKQDGSEQD